MGVFELLDEHYKMQQGGTWEKQKAKVQKEKYQGNNLLEMLQEDRDLIERLSKKDRIKKETNIKTSDNTKVNTKNKPELTSKSARNKTDKEIAQEREAKIQASVEAQKTPYTKENWRQQLAAETVATGDKFRVSLEPNFFDDYLNPAAMIGNMASNLGQAPLQAQQQDSYMPYVTSVGMPLAVGAMAGLGTNGSTGQFVNNLANPLAGFGLKDKALDAIRIGKEIIQNPKVVIGETIKEIKKLPNQAEQVYHTFMDRNKPLYKIGSDNLENALESKVKNLQTDEGFNRLFNQELEITRNINPYSRESDLIEKANKNANARIDELSQTENLNKSYLNAKSENPNINVNPFLDFGIPKNNAHFQGNYNNAIDLKKINKDFVLDDGAIKPGKIAIGREYAEDIGVFAHEINHALQNGRQTKIDKDIIEHFSNLENRKEGLVSKKRSSDADEAALSYLLTGSKGKEPSSFLAEARQAMLNKNLIKDIYEPITPEIVEKSMNYFSKNPIKNKYTKSSSTRIFDIANKNSAEFLANQMNKLPVIAPIAGATYLATQGQEEPKKFQRGGEIKYSENEKKFLDELARLKLI